MQKARLMALTQATKQLIDLLKLRMAPVTLTFRSAPPANIPHIASAGASGCTYWWLAAQGHVFYTEAADHYPCPIGAYTHGIELPPAQVKELENVVGMMLRLGYLRAEEVAGIARRQGTFGVALYAPLAQTTWEPDVVLVRGNAKQVMLLAEAAQAAGAGPESGLMGRPTCAAIPEVLCTGHAAASLGCIGNRVYTGLADDELYFVLPGGQLASIVEKVATLVLANQELENYHRARQAANPLGPAPLNAIDPKEGAIHVS
jgi:uncharacterized protein (DUF169 family)